jgi:hypothetical protein
MPSNELRHYGVPGMKWGQRKAGRAPAKASTDRKAVDAIRKKAVPAMSNKQLKTANSRLQLEKTYSELTKEQSGLDKVKKGNDAAKAILAIGGTGIAAYTMAQSPAAKAAIKLGARVIRFAASAAAGSASSGTTDAGFYAASRVAARAISR